MTASPLRQFQNRILRERVVPLGARSILNIGSMPHEQDREGKPYRDYFPGTEYRTLNKRPGADYCCNIMSREGAPEERFGLVLLMNVLEHVESPLAAALFSRLLMAPAGHLFVAVPFLFPLHPGRDFGDFWRFTPGGLGVLFPDLRLEWCAEAPASAGYCALFKEATP